MKPRRSLSTNDYDRSQEHNSHSIALLEYFQSIPQDSPLHYWPTTSELQDMKRFGLRPVNRIGDLRDGKIEHYRYDIEKISCGHGINRWRFHWPNRPGHPKPKNQTVLPLNSPISSFSAGKREETERERPARDTRHNRALEFERTFGKPKPSAGTTDSTTLELPLFAELHG